MSAVGLGVGLAATRFRRASSVAAVGAAFAFVALDAVMERSVSHSAAVDDVLFGAVFGIAIPVLAYLASERASDGTRLEDSVADLGRHGADRRHVALGLLLAVAALAGAAGAGLALLGTVLAHGGQPWTTAGIGALGGATYAAWFGAASTVGRRGQGRFWALALDWLLGSGTTVLALPWPRGHLSNLLGAEPILSMPAWSASLTLIALALAFTGIALARTAR